MKREAKNERGGRGRGRKVSSLSSPRPPRLLAPFFAAETARKRLLRRLCYSSLSSVLVEISHSGVRGRIRSHITAGTRAVKCNFASKCFCGQKKKEKRCQISYGFTKAKIRTKRSHPAQRLQCVIPFVLITVER